MSLLTVYPPVPHKTELIKKGNTSPTRPNIGRLKT